MLAQVGFCRGPALDSGDRLQPSIEAADADADHSAQHGHGMVGPLDRHEGELRHAIPLAKKAAAFRRIWFSSSSRLLSRRSRCISASSALRWTRASADPAARCSVRQVLIWPVLNPSSVATSDRLRPSSTRCLRLELRREPPPDAFVCHCLLLEFGGSLANPPPPGGKPRVALTAWHKARCAAHAPQ